MENIKKNVIFLDIDGVLNTWHTLRELLLYENEKYYNEVQNEKLKILSEICHRYDCKVVMSSTHKDIMDEKTLEIKNDGEEWFKELLEAFKIYDIELIGRTPTVTRKDTETDKPFVWKEDEIRLYLFRHPEIDHYVILDDDDLEDKHKKSDLDKVKAHLVKTDNHLENHSEKEGLLERHIDEVGEVLKKENEIKKFALKRQERRTM